MGNCTSHGFGPAIMAAKLILIDGQLEEFSSPVKVSELMVKRNPDCFICNSDDMEFDCLVSAMDGGESLLPGQLYFELPLIFLTQRLQAKDMASLAVKASLALSTRSSDDQYYFGCYRSPKRQIVEDPLVFLHDEDNVKVKSRTRSRNNGTIHHVPADYCDSRFVKSRRSPASGKAGNIKVTKFTATLSTIFEIEDSL